MPEHDHKLHEDIGFIKATLEAMHREFYDPKEGVKAKIACLDTKLDSIESRITWVTAWASGVAGTITLAFYLFKTFVWDRLSGKG